MSFELPTHRKVIGVRPRWSGAAFLVEAMLLLVFIMASLAVFTQLFAASAERANQSRDLTDAVAIASTTAERFAADPQGVAREFTQGRLRVVCDVRPEARQGGTMYYATISVYADAESAGDGLVASGQDAASSESSGVARAVDASDSAASVIGSSGSAAAAGAGAQASASEQVSTAEDSASSGDSALYSVSTARYVSGV